MLRVAEQAFRSDTGRQRTANEDSYYASAPLFVVADGMGGAQAGEVASRIAAESFEEADRAGEAAEAFLRRIAETANQRIHGLAEHDSSRSGMGTTLTAALVDGDEVAIAQVGDSRAYVHRDGELHLLTSDHSLVEELRRQGRLTPEQADEHPQRSIITRALGPEAEVEVDTLTYRARPGDAFLICSDGLTTMIKDERIAEVLTEAEALDEAVVRLVGEANEAGGRDNITVVAFRLEESGDVVVEEGATLIGPSAEAAGLTAEGVRSEAARRRQTADSTSDQEKPRRSRVRTAVKVLVGLLIVAALAVGAYLGARQVYFLGVDEGGRVALYRGLPYDLPLEVSLYSEVYSVPIQADSVPEDRRDSVTDHELRSRDDAVSLLEDLEAAAAPTTPTPSPSPNNNGNGDGGNPDGQRQGGNPNRSSAGGGGVGGSREPELSGRKSQGTPGTADRTRGHHAMGDVS